MQVEVAAGRPRLVRLDTVILRVRDAAAAAAWYARTLGFGVAYEDATEGLIVLDGCTPPLTLWEWQAGERPPVSGAASCYPIFGSADAAADARALAALGVEVGPVQEGPGVRFFRFSDPDGNLLEACQAE